jgi:hypothetical protein
MGRQWGQHPEQLVKVHLVKGFLCQYQMTEMRRIETAAKYPDAFAPHNLKVYREHLAVWSSQAMTDWKL